jgi:hypothetical protein
VNRFRYLGDPVFLVAVALYLLNRLWWKPAFGSAWLVNWFNDGLLIPGALPVLLWIHRRAGWRQHDRPPGWGEITLHLAIWAIVCEVLGPLLLRGPVGDPLDVLAYVIGGLLAGVIWQRRDRHLIRGIGGTWPCTSFRSVR